MRHLGIHGFEVIQWPFVAVIVLCQFVELVESHLTIAIALAEQSIV